MKDTTFKKYPRLERYFETSDETKFFSEHDAKNHANSLKDKNVKQVKKTFSKDEKESKKEGGQTPMQKAQLRAKAIDSLETVEAVEKALEGETAKSVLKAGADKIEAIKASNEAISNKEKTE